MRWIDRPTSDEIEVADPLDPDPLTVKELMTALELAGEGAKKELGREN